MDRGDYTEPMAATEPNQLGAKEAARRIERGELSAQALIASCLERIAAREAEVGAWVFIDKKPAIALDMRPLFGLPVGVKDIFDTADMPTEHGSPIYAGNRPRNDAAPVALTRKAGGTILGKTVTAEFATFVPRGTRNPRDPARTPGGSSSGSAAAVADCMVPLAFGTQTAGSVIRPGSYCGVVAYKPTYNTLPRAGVKPNADSLDTVGLYARSVEDAAFFIDALIGMKPATLGRPRIGLCRTWEWHEVQPEMAAAFESAARRLDAEEVRLPDSFKGLRAAHTAIIRFEGARSLADEYRRFPQLVDPALRKRCELGYAIAWPEYADAREAARQARARLEDAFAGCDVLIAPAATGEAPLGLASTGDVAMNVVWTLLHAPCVSLPVMQSPSGLPLGLQVIGRIGDDARTLACASWIEGAFR
jgi:Asp-tRNA(Asn)/Glu-tRNA(Gln) amidotransferase A subunit family amidase